MDKRCLAKWTASYEVGLIVQAFDLNRVLFTPADKPILTVS